MESKSSPLKIRADVLLVKSGISPTRSKAQELISEGDVEVLSENGWVPVSSVSQLLLQESKMRLIDPRVLQFVSRGGRKLSGALEDFKIDVTGLTVFDIGQSTGGFTDCVLQAGAKAVVGIDVGHNQLHPSLKSDARVVSFEKTHVRDLRSNSSVTAEIQKLKPDLAVVDLSFISTLSLIPEIETWATKMLLLIKPQYELETLFGNKKELVITAEIIQDLKDLAKTKLSTRGWSIIGVYDSRIRGKDGSPEFFIYATYAR